MADTPSAPDTFERELLDLLDLIGQLAGDDPISHSYEGLGDDCFFCGVPETSVYIKPNFHSHATHAHGCAWVEARQLLGKDLGMHTVTGMPDE